MKGADKTVAALLGKGPDRGLSIMPAPLPADAAIALPDALPLGLMGRRPDIVASRWRVEKVERVVPGDLKPALKAYLWALQNPHITAVISNLWDETHVKENLALAGKKVTLRPA